LVKMRHFGSFLANKRFAFPERGAMISAPSG
jgi:hypothetical protein